MRRIINSSYEQHQRYRHLHKSMERAFVAEYETFRSKAFTGDEHATIAAAATCALAYGARCEHCVDPRADDFPVGSSREALARYGDRFLTP